MGAGERVPPSRPVIGSIPPDLPELPRDVTRHADLQRWFVERTYLAGAALFVRLVLETATDELAPVRQAHADALVRALELGSDRGRTLGLAFADEGALLRYANALRDGGAIADARRDILVAAAERATALEAVASARAQPGYGELMDDGARILADAALAFSRREDARAWRLVYASATQARAVGGLLAASLSAPAPPPASALAQLEVMLTGRTMLIGAAARARSGSDQSARDALATAIDQADDRFDEALSAYWYAAGGRTYDLWSDASSAWLAHIDAVARSDAWAADAALVRLREWRRQFDALMVEVARPLPEGMVGQAIASAMPSREEAYGALAKGDPSGWRRALDASADARPLTALITQLAIVDFPERFR